MGYNACADLLFGFPLPEDFEGRDELLERHGNGDPVSEYLHEVSGIDEGQFFITMGKRYNTDWDAPLELPELLEPSSEEYLLAEKFCQEIGIAWQQPKWLLVASYW